MPKNPVEATRKSMSGSNNDISNTFLVTKPGMVTGEIHGDTCLTAKKLPNSLGGSENHIAQYAVAAATKRKLDAFRYLTPSSSIATDAKSTNATCASIDWEEGAYDNDNATNDTSREADHATGEVMWQKGFEAPYEMDQPPLLAPHVEDISISSERYHEKKHNLSDFQCDIESLAADGDRIDWNWSLHPEVSEPLRLDLEDRPAQIWEESTYIKNDEFSEELGDDDLLNLVAHQLSSQHSAGVSGARSTAHEGCTQLPDSELFTELDELEFQPPLAENMTSDQPDHDAGNCFLLVDDELEVELLELNRTSTVANQHFRAALSSLEYESSLPTMLQTDAPASQLATLVQEDTNIYKPIVRPPFPDQARDRSPVVGLSADTLLRTCFRVGEALNTGCNAARQGRNVIIELYARAISSYRESKTGKQHFVFADLFHNHPPFLNGVYELWKGVELWDYDSSLFLGPPNVERMCRCIGRLKREGKGWKFIVLNIWQASWDDVDYVKGIVCSS